MKKALSLLLVLAMTLCLLPAAALATASPLSVTAYSPTGSQYDRSALEGLGISVSGSTVTLNGVESSEVGGIKITSAEDLTLTIEGDNAIANTCDPGLIALEINGDGGLSSVTIGGTGSLTLSSENGKGLYVHASSIDIENASIDATGYQMGVHFAIGNGGLYQNKFHMTGASLKGESTSAHGEDCYGIWVHGTDTSLSDSHVTGISVSDGSGAGIWFYGPVDAQENTSITAKGLYSGLWTENFNIDDSVATAQGSLEGISFCRMTIEEGGNVYAYATDPEEYYEGALLGWMLTLNNGGYLKAHSGNDASAVSMWLTHDPVDGTNDGINLGDSFTSVETVAGLDPDEDDVVFLANSASATFSNGALSFVSLGTPTLSPTLPDPFASEGSDSEISEEKIAENAELTRVLTALNAAEDEEGNTNPAVIEMNGNVLNYVSWRIAGAMSGRNVILKIAVGKNIYEVSGLYVLKPERNRVFYTIDAFIALYSK